MLKISQKEKMDETMVLHDKIEELIAEKKYKELKALLDGENPVDIAEALYGLDDKALALAFRLLKKDDAADTFVSMAYRAFLFFKHQIFGIADITKRNSGSFADHFPAQNTFLRKKKVQKTHIFYPSEKINYSYFEKR